MADTTPNKILYVEDEPDIRTIARIALETVGKFQVKMCSSGKEALAEVEEFAPDCILLDVMMPGMDGPSVLKALRQIPACAHIPVIFMTAKVQSSEVAQYTAIGAIGVIPKPFDPMKLAQSVRQMLGDH
ncbi:MAG: response regulator [Burkholderiales bacterium]|nr:response regulator [Burkholderiales bacterium]